MNEKVCHVRIDPKRVEQIQSLSQDDVYVQSEIGWLTNSRCIAEELHTLENCEVSTVPVTVARSSSRQC